MVPSLALKLKIFPYYSNPVYYRPESKHFPNYSPTTYIGCYKGYKLSFLFYFSLNVRESLIIGRILALATG